MDMFNAGMEPFFNRRLAQREAELRNCTACQAIRERDAHYSPAAQSRKTVTRSTP